MNDAAIEAINDSIRYTNWTVFRLTGSIDDPHEAQLELTAWVEALGDSEVTVRGVYDVRAFRGDADLLLWLHAERAEQVQQALKDFSHLSFGRQFVSTWSGMGLHRPAEFNRKHVPGFMTGAKAKSWMCVYPFVRSYDWYLLPEDERREMLVEHGIAGHKYPTITSSTVAAFALGDYEWMLALESEQLHQIVDMMRDLRYTKARMHVREEVPFFTGRRVEFDQIAENYV